MVYPHFRNEGIVNDGSNNTNNNTITLQWWRVFRAWAHYSCCCCCCCSCCCSTTFLLRFMFAFCPAFNQVTSMRP